MAEKDIIAKPESTDKPILTVVPLPRKRLPLKTVSDVRREMGRVYRDMRANRLDTQEGGRLAYVLFNLGKLIELDELEQRVTALEQHGNYKP